MKKYIIIFMLFPIIAAAQSNIPTTPFTGFFSEKRGSADKITRSFYDGRGELYFQENIICHKSKDGLTDTLVYGNNATEIRTYNNKNELQNYKAFFNISPEKIETDEHYTYGNDGSIKQIDAVLFTTKYYNTSTSIDSIVIKKFNDYLNKVIPYNKDIIEHTPYGYKCSSFGFDLEKEAYNNTPIVKKYYFANNRLYKVESESNLGDYISDTYEYNMNGYTHTNYEIKDSPYFKYEYTLNFYGDIEKTIYYKWKRVEAVWAIEALHKYNYEYPSATGIIPIKQQSKIHYNNGSITVSADSPASLYIYNMQGNLIKNTKITAGQNCFQLERGIYIIKIGNTVQKIVCSN